MMSIKQLLIFAAFSLIFSLIFYHNSFNNSKLIKLDVSSFPYASQGNRLLFTIVSFDSSHIEHTHVQLKNIRDMCEGGVDVVVHVHTTDDELDKYLQITECGMMWCGRINRDVPVQFIQHPKSIGKNLPCIAHDTIYKYRNDFDWFLQTEDDIDIRLSTLLEFWRTVPLTQFLNEKQDKFMKPGWVIFDRNPAYLVLTDMGSANATAFDHSSLKKFDGDEYFLIPAYMCGFLISRYEMMQLVKRRVFLFENIKGDISQLPWPMEQCNGMRFAVELQEYRAVPVNSLRRLMVHHLTNRYSSDGLRVKVRDFFKQWGYEYDSNQSKYIKVRSAANPNKPGVNYDQ